jgi:hypothetical protein
MALGYNVDKGTLDMKAASTVLQLRQAFDNVEAIAAWLGNHPSNGGNDPLTGEGFGYSADEAYVLRSFFETMEGVRTSNAAVFETGRKMTGLE